MSNKEKGYVLIRGRRNGDQEEKDYVFCGWNKTYKDGAICMTPMVRPFNFNTGYFIGKIYSVRYCNSLHEKLFYCVRHTFSDVRRISTEYFDKWKYKEVC